MNLMNPEIMYNFIDIYNNNNNSNNNDTVHPR